MEELLITPHLLALLFLVVAFAYSSVGLGGGTAYTALLAVFGASHLAIPTISLTLNVVVTAVGSWVFLRHRYGRLRLVAPFLVTSLPFAYVGGMLDLSPGLFYALLVLTLAAVAGRIFLWTDPRVGVDLGRGQQLALAVVLGALIGFVGGSVGFGGGIFVVPVAVLLGLGTEREAAACGAVFTGVTSASGLLARVQHHPVDWEAMLPLVVAVLIGGSVGAQAGSRRLSPRTMQKVMGVVAVVAAVLLVHRIWRG